MSILLAQSHVNKCQSSHQCLFIFKINQVKANVQERPPSSPETDSPTRGEEVGRGRGAGGRGGWGIGGGWGLWYGFWICFLIFSFCSKVRPRENFFVQSEQKTKFK